MKTITYKLKTLYLFLLLTAGVFFIANAQKIEKLGIENGLSQSSVYSMLQDSFGFLWVGTADGLNRYDGHHFKTYRFTEKQLQEGAGNFFSGPMIEDSLHQIWFGGSFGIGRWNFFTDKLELIPLKIRNSYHQAMLLKIEPDLIWFSIGYDLACCKPSSGETHYFPIPYLNRKYDFYSNFKVDNSGCIWMNTHYGINCFDTKSKKFRCIVFPIKYRIPENFLFLLNIDDKGSLWLNSKSGIIKVDAVSSKIELVFPQFANTIVYGFEIKGKQIIVGAQGLGIQIFDLLSKRLINKIGAGPGNNQLSNLLITMFYSDRSENLWIGLDGFGLNRLNLAKSKFELINNETFPNWPVKSNFIKTFYQYGDTLFFGTHEYGLCGLILSSRSFFRVKTPAKAGNVITGIFKKEKSKLWLSTLTHVFIYDLETKKFKEIPILLNENVRAGNLGIVSIYPLKSGAVLACTFYGNYFYNGGTNEKFRPVKSHNTYCAFACQDMNETIWVSSIRDGAISRYKLVGKELLYLDFLLEKSNVRAFYEDTVLKHLWMASEKGLIDYNFTNKTFKIITSKNGLANNYLYGVLPGIGDELWLSSNKGLICYHRNSGKIENYDVSYGLQSNEFNTGSLFKNDNNELFFGGINGFNRFKPGQISVNRHIPVVVLSGLSVFEIPYSDSINPMSINHLNFPFDQNTFTFEFSANELNQSGKVTLKYKLIGVDKDWISDFGNRKARYPNLPPGNYVLLAKAGNSDGKWSDEKVLVSIHISKQWWMEWQVLLIEILLCSYLIWLSIKVFVRMKLKEKQRELEKIKSIQQERERISKDMHDDLGSGLTKISILSELLKQNIAEDFRNQQLGKISETAGELVDNMGNLVWTLNPGNDSLHNLLAYLRQYINNYFESTQIQVNIVFQEDVPDLILQPQLRKNIFLTMKETCNNAAKYAHAKNIDFSFTLNGRTCFFEIEDNGVGFEMSSTRAFGNGLVNMKKRMEEIGGSFRIQSIPGSGTKTTIYFEIRN